MKIKMNPTPLNRKQLLEKNEQLLKNELMLTAFLIASTAMCLLISYWCLPMVLLFMFLHKQNKQNMFNVAPVESTELTYLLKQHHSPVAMMYINAVLKEQRPFVQHDLQQLKRMEP